ncbi:hypothetical protein ACH5RR_008584 [Cinchona calisaya]|uniref:Uncharacterized protein n=1 Tax=Cinchona calisaya TaxID=153742 RepID=A0ABD3AFL6_9GENT
MFFSSRNLVPRNYHLIYCIDNSFHQVNSRRFLFYIQLFIEPGVETPSLHIHSSWSGYWSSELPSRLECSLPAKDRNVPVQVRRRLVPETVAATREVNYRTCCNLRITRQLFRSIEIRRHSTILLGGGLFSRVTDPAIIDSYL